MRKAFTLVELLVVVAIIASMVTVSVVSLRAGQGAARVRGSARDVFAVIRHARSVALVSQQPSIITYECRTEEGVARSKVTVTSTKILSTESRPAYETLSGEPVKTVRDSVIIEDDDPDDDGAKLGKDGGNTVEDILFAPISEDVLTDIRIKVTKGDELLELEESEQKKVSKVSVFSNVDYLLGKFDEKKRAEREKAEEEAETSAPALGDKDDQEPVSIVWEANGRCEPHRVWIYKDGAAPDSGLMVKVDRFGGATVINPEEDRD